jgi:hypothetical protein
VCHTEQELQEQQFSKEKDKFRAKLRNCASSDISFDVRFAIVRLLSINIRAMGMGIEWV